eukprot:tig00021348_g20516.t1
MDSFNAPRRGDASLVDSDRLRLPRSAADDASSSPAAEGEEGALQLVEALGAEGEEAAFSDLAALADRHAPLL